MPKTLLVLLFNLSIATTPVWAQEDTEAIQLPVRSQAAAPTLKDSMESSVETPTGCGRSMNNHSRAPNTLN
jgi:hypothetical protein